MKGVMKFGKKEKLSPRYIGPYQIVKCNGKVSYELDLQNELASVHHVFHVSMLKKCIGDPSSVIPLEGLGIDEILSYEEVPVEILDWHVKRLRNKEITFVKVLWRNHLVEGATLKAEANMKFDILISFLLFLFKLESHGKWARAQECPRVGQHTAPTSTRVLMTRGATSGGLGSSLLKICTKCSSSSRTLHDSWEGSWEGVGCVRVERSVLATSSRSTRGTTNHGAPREVAFVLWAEVT
ncbi:hypothetical protein MTR67_043639 [Solanum verrucosum]|uniref:Tf2-1-like SH3-like domain-containing protein n=1 Tax=Solanum verrucosum TaxID=315347 RepID=A0AAF0ZVB8_SOLVR|nr:hypothetical protein MTR67_043639 [Solanum verrucosum]